MINIEKTKEILEKEYSENCTKIDELSKKIRIINANDFETRLTGVFAFSLIPWVITMALLPPMINSGIIPINLISPLSISIPASIGITGDAILTGKTLTPQNGKSSNSKIE